MFRSATSADSRVISVEAQQAFDVTGSEPPGEQAVQILGCLGRHVGLQDAGCRDARVHQRARSG
jgi:hypothetical protein